MRGCDETGIGWERPPRGPRSGATDGEHHALARPHSDFAPLHAAASDYDIVRRAIGFISEQWRKQPEIEEIAHAVGVTATELHHLFRRWSGLTPKAFLQAITLDRARTLLRSSASVLDAAYEVGLSGPGRLHDLFVTHEAMSPGEWKAGGEGLTLHYGFHPSPVRHRAGHRDAARPRRTCVRRSGRGEGGARRHAGPLAEGALCRGQRAHRAAGAAHLRFRASGAPDQPLRVVLIGTDWEVRVWETLLKIPMGQATTYSDIARKVGSEKASRAVGAAVGKNPVSFVVPCHRVLGKSGKLTGYHWGITRKCAMLGWEAGRVGAA